MRSLFYVDNHFSPSFGLETKQIHSGSDFYCNYRLIVDIGMPTGCMSEPRKQPMESERQLACRDTEIQSCLQGKKYRLEGKMEENDFFFLIACLPPTLCAALYIKEAVPMFGLQWLNSADILK